MSTKTTNLQLTKPAYGEAADISVINANMDIIDGTVAGKVTAPSSTVTTDTVAVFDGTTGKLIKSSGFTIGKSVPSNAVFTDNDTKNTAGTTNKTGTKLFLAGATSQAANPQTYSNSNVYIGTDNALYSKGKQVVNLSDTQALTNKTYNGYTLKDACAKEVDTVVTAGSSKLPTSDAVATAIASASKTLFCKIGKTSNTLDFNVDAVLDMQYDDYTQQNDNGEVFTVTTVGVQCITVKKSGWYRLEHSCYLMRSTDGRIEATVRFNSTSEYLYSVMFCAGNIRYTCVLSQIIHMDAGDRVSPQIWGGSEHGGTVGVAEGNGRVNFLSLTLMSLD